MKDGDNETYHEWLARTKRESEFADINRKHINRLRILAVVVLWALAIALTALFGGPAPRPPEATPNITTPPPCIGGIDHV